MLMSWSSLWSHLKQITTVRIKRLLYAIKSEKVIDIYHHWTIYAQKGFLHKEWLTG
jgi:hypothetical protein